MEKQDIRKFSLEELQEIAVQADEKAFRGKQIHEWLWKKGAVEFSDMTNLSKSFREYLESNFVINNIELAESQISSDGTIKNAVKLFDGKIVESVLIPTSTRTTACVSSQVGCSMDCTFCATARMKRMRNLNPDEIFDQVVTIDQQSRKNHNRPLSNIVFMGMGEPLLNYPNVMEAIDKITSDKGLGMSSRRITLSTVGIPKMIKKLADDNPKIKLALSLHSAIDEVRENIIPFHKKIDFPELLDSLNYWYSKTKSIITLEYVIWKNINDTKEDVEALVKFCKKVPSKVNLIEYNDIGDANFMPAPDSVTDMYTNILNRNNITVTIRKSRGKDIDAACGQLANKD